MTSVQTQSTAEPRATRPVIAVVGATGAVGQEFLRVLGQRQFPLGGLKLLASARSAGQTAEFKGQTIVIDELTEQSFEGIDIALFAAGGPISKRYAQAAVGAGAVVIDNSSAFRMTDGVPLVVPEVNPEAIQAAGIGLGSGRRSGQRPGGLIANPNCSTIIMLMAVTPIHRAVGVKRIVCSTYQAASGAGAAAMAELEELLDGLEAADVDVDVLADRVARGVEQLRICRARLDEVSGDVESVVAELVAIDTDGDGGSDGADPAEDDG